MSKPPSITSAPPGRFMNRREIAALLGVPYSTIRKWHADGTLPYWRNGRDFYSGRKAVEALAEQLDRQAGVNQEQARQRSRWPLRKRA